MESPIDKFGSYVMLMGRVFSVPTKWRIFFKQLIEEIYKLGVDSTWIVIIISIFMGSIMCLQVALNITSPLLPAYALGYTVRETLILEFSSSVMCLILAGKVGSNIASEIGTMRITEQIDALDIMGINSASYLILPKVVAMMLFIPILASISIILGIVGGYFVAYFTDITNVTTFETGIQFDFKPFLITYAIIKSVIFAFVICSIASFYGYNVDIKGGSLEVGKASTDSVVISSVMILLLDICLTKLILQ
ncbi:MAG TPA: ABC transporter permease [Porphyromonadaceae bacterium]|nr:ABC transporter permease [Porphyromonadaceae bacterium]